MREPGFRIGSISDSIGRVVYPQCDIIDPLVYYPQPGSGLSRITLPLEGGSLRFQAMQGQFSLVRKFNEG